MDVQILIEQAKEHILIAGQVIPKIYLELEEKIIVVNLSPLSEIKGQSEQCAILRSAGHDLSTHYPQDKPQSIYFHCKAWLNEEEKENKHEGILISEWKHSQTKPTTFFLPVTRDQNGTILTIGDAGIYEEGCPQLIAFVKGMLNDTHANTEDLTEDEQTITNWVESLTAEQQRRLLRFMRK